MRRPVGGHDDHRLRPRHLQLLLVLLLLGYGCLRGLRRHATRPQRKDLLGLLQLHLPRGLQLVRKLREELWKPGERPQPQKEEILHPHDFAGGPRIIASRGRAATMHDLSSVSTAPNELAPPALGERERAGSMVALIGDAPTLDGRRRGSTLNTAEI